MSIASEISRITQDRNSLRSKLVNLGVPGVTSASNLDTITTKVNDINNSTAGDVVVSTTATAQVELDPGKQVTISKGYYNSDRIIRATIADLASEVDTDALALSGLKIEMTDKTALVTVGEPTTNIHPYIYPISISSLEATVSASTYGWLASQTAGVQDVNGGKVGTMRGAVVSVTSSQSTSGSASMTPTGFQASSSATSVYVTLNTTSGKSLGTASCTSAGYLPTGSAGGQPVFSATTISVTGNGDKVYIPTKAAATITPGTTDTSIPSGAYLTGAQTIKAVNFGTESTKAVATDIRKDKTVKIVSNGTALGTITGTMAEYSGDTKVTTTVSCGQTYTIPTGYHNGGTVTGASLSSQTPGTAAAGDILSGETAWVNGSQLTGTLTVNNFYTGNVTPDSTLGSNGDFYFMI